MKVYKNSHPSIMIPISIEIYENIICEILLHLFYVWRLENQLVLTPSLWEIGLVLFKLNYPIIFLWFYIMFTSNRYYSGEKTAPILTIFIGGNHEASNYLAELPYGGWVCPNIYYMGELSHSIFNVIRTLLVDFKKFQ